MLTNEIRIQDNTIRLTIHIEHIFPNQIGFSNSEKSFDYLNLKT